MGRVRDYPFPLTQHAGVLYPNLGKGKEGAITPMLILHLPKVRVKSHFDWGGSLTLVPTKVISLIYSYTISESTNIGLLARLPGCHPVVAVVYPIYMWAVSAIGQSTPTAPFPFSARHFFLMQKWSDSYLLVHKRGLKLLSQAHYATFDGTFSRKESSESLTATPTDLVTSNRGTNTDLQAPKRDSNMISVSSSPGMLQYTLTRSART